MYFSKLDDMIGGWFIGNFSPSVHRRKDFEIGVKYYKAGSKNPPHVHRIATEITIIIHGQAKIAGRKVCPGDIITVEPGECADFVAIEDVSIAVVKFPSVTSDKYIPDQKY